MFARSTSAGRDPGGADPPGGRRARGAAPRAATRGRNGRSVDPELARRRAGRSRRSRARPRSGPRRRSRRGRRSRRAAARTRRRRRRRGGQAPRREARRPRSPPPPSGRAASSERPTISRTISRVRELAGRPRRDVTAVAEHRDDVGERADLLEPVADEDDCDAALAQPAHGREQVLDLVRRERGGRLVHDQQPRAGGERLGDLEQLPVGDAEARAPAYRDRSRPRARRGAAPLSSASRASRRCRGGRAGGARRRRSPRRSDPGRRSAPGTSRRCRAGARPAGSPIRCGSPSIEDLAVVGLDDARQDLHERRLAGAVLADERVHRARARSRS